MPQLELIWFVTKFILAWSLIIFTFLCLMKQNKTSNKYTPKKDMKKMTKTSHKWKW